MSGFGGRTSADQVLKGLDGTGKVVVVTGATTGIGFETARAIAATGARVYCGARSELKAIAALDRIRAQQPTADVRAFVADLARLDSCADAVRAFPDAKVHAFVANAGITAGRFETTADGLERTIAVCHYGHAALIRGLTDRLVAAAPARLVMVASHSHRGERRLDPERLSLAEREWGSMRAYDRAKLCNVLYANAFDRRFAPVGIRSNSLHPGNLVSTDLGRSSRLVALAQWVYRPFSKTLGQAAATSVWAALHPDLADTGGAYLVDCSVRRASPTASDPALADRLWDHTETLLEQRLGPVGSWRG